MKIMHYCQHVLGIGHFFRSLEIARALSRHDVLLVEGGEPLPGLLLPPHLQRVFLPPLRMDSEFSRLETREGSLDAVQTSRRRLLQELFHDFRPDVLLIELFPFGRRGFRFELLPLLEAVKAGGRDTRVVCSLRDILVEKADQAKYEQRVLGLLHAHFHLLLIHSDPRIISLQETFSRVKDIAIPVAYTGFVVKTAVPAGRSGPAGSASPSSVPNGHQRGKRSPPAMKIPPNSPLEKGGGGDFHGKTRESCVAGGKRIIASSGGGEVGADLLAATILAVGQLADPDIRLRVFMGPFLQETDRLRLAEIAATDGRISLQPFSLNFLEELGEARLSISMAGYNTCMDILATRVPALVYPFRRNREQAMRARRLEALGFLEVIETLDGALLATAIQRALDRMPPAPVVNPDLSGAENSALCIEKFCGHEYD
jgi:predicted glycosyltransferase